MKNWLTNGVVRRQRVARQDHARHLLEQPLLEARPDALKQQRMKSVGLTRRQIERQDAAERDAHHRRPFQAEPVKELGQVVHEVRQIEPAPQREAIVFAAQLVADDLEIARQQAR